MLAAPRQRGRIDLDDRADHHEVPVRRRFRDAVEQREIHPFVDHAEESEPRVRDLPLVGWLEDESARLREVLRRRRCSGNAWTLGCACRLAS